MIGSGVGSMGMRWSATCRFVSVLNIHDDDVRGALCDSVTPKVGWEYYINSFSYFRPLSVLIVLFYFPRFVMSARSSFPPST